uniref:ZP domain-containing protein n=1 Tax=Globodera rostochiensis TaxID=31243 RepID=A0A914HLQ5_GLORO
MLLAEYAASTCRTREMVHLLLVLLLLLLLPNGCWSATTNARMNDIDNELVGDPVVECEETMISLTFKTKKPFNGRVYVQGMADDERCARNFASNSDQSKFSMMIQNGDCTMQRQRVTGSLEGMMLSLTIVVSFHGTFVTRSDRAYRCMCFFRNIKTLTNAIDVNLVATTELLDTAKTPSCLYSIHAQSPEGPPVQLGKVGDKIFHVWQCDDPAYGFLVHSCAVDDGRGSKFDLLDVDGCAIDPVIQPDVVYVREKKIAYVETFGYKFSDTTVLNYQCSVELCKRANNECQGLSPPICGRQKRGIFGNGQPQWMTKRNGTGDNMDLVTSLEMMDAIYEGGSADRRLMDSAIEKALELQQERGEMITQLTEQEDPEGRMAQNCLHAMAVAFCISVLAAVLLISFAVLIVVVIVKRKVNRKATFDFQSSIAK